MPEDPEPVRILRIIGRLNVGGPAMHAITLTRRLDRLGYETTLVRGVEGPREGSMDYLATELGVSPIRVPTLRREIGWRDLPAFFVLRRLLRQFEPAILDTHLAKAGTLGRLAWLSLGRRRHKIVTVHTFHGHVFTNYFSAWRTKLFMLIERWLAGESSAVVAVSEEVKEDLVRLGIAPAEKVVVIPLGLDLQQFQLDPATARDLRRSERERLGLSADDRVVTLIARLVPIKRVDRFLRVAARLADAPRTRFLVVGDGDLHDELTSSPEAQRLGHRLVWAGLQRDMRSVCAASDVVVLTSDNEGTPVSLIEAHAAGKPAVATDVGGVRAVVRNGETGWVVELDDEKRFADAVRRLLDEPELADGMGARGREHVMGSFSIDRLADEVDRFYRVCLGSRIPENGSVPVGARV